MSSRHRKSPGPGQRDDGTCKPYPSSSLSSDGGLEVFLGFTSATHPLLLAQRSSSVRLTSTTQPEKPSGRLDSSIAILRRAFSIDKSPPSSAPTSNNSAPKALLITSTKAIDISYLVSPLSYWIEQVMGQRVEAYVEPDESASPHPSPRAMALRRGMGGKARPESGLAEAFSSLFQSLHPPPAPTIKPSEMGLRDRSASISSPGSTISPPFHPSFTERMRRPSAPLLRAPPSSYVRSSSSSRASPPLPRSITTTAIATKPDPARDSTSTDDYPRSEMSSQSSLMRSHGTVNHPGSSPLSSRSSPHPGFKQGKCPFLWMINDMISSLPPNGPSSPPLLLSSSPSSLSPRCPKTHPSWLG